jgi:hypothetical protein
MILNLYHLTFPWLENPLDNIDVVSRQPDKPENQSKQRFLPGGKRRPGWWKFVLTSIIILVPNHKMITSRRQLITKE